MPKEPKVNITYGKPKVTYKDIIDPDRFRNTVIPAILNLIEESEQLEAAKVNGKAV